MISSVCNPFNAHQVAVATSITPLATCFMMTIPIQYLFNIVKQIIYSMISIEGTGRGVVKVRVQKEMVVRLVF